MTTTIMDGTGSGSSAKVDSVNRLQAFSTTQPEFEFETKLGNSYIVTSGLVTLTSTSRSAILYLKSGEDVLVVKELVVQAGQSTGGTTTDVIRTDIVAPTGGTLISNAVPAIVANLNPGSSNTLNATTFRGVEGDTLTGQVAELDSLAFVSSQLKQETGTIVPKGAILAIAITPPAGNTSIKVGVSATVYKLTEV